MQLVLLKDFSCNLHRKLFSEGVVESEGTVPPSDSITPPPDLLLGFPSKFPCLRQVHRYTYGSPGRPNGRSCEVLRHHLSHTQVSDHSAIPDSPSSSVSLPQPWHSLSRALQRKLYPSIIAENNSRQDVNEYRAGLLTLPRLSEQPINSLTGIVRHLSDNPQTVRTEKGWSP